MKHLVLLTSLSKACCFSEVIVSRHALRVRKLHMKLVKEQGRYCCLVACLGKSALNTAPTLIFLVKFPFILKSVFFFNNTKLPTIIQHSDFYFSYTLLKNKPSKDLSFQEIFHYVQHCHIQHD